MWITNNNNINEDDNKINYDSNSYRKISLPILQ